jgi:hypothetical protein
MAKSIFRVGIDILNRSFAKKQPVRCGGFQLPRKPLYFSVVWQEEASVIYRMYGVACPFGMSWIVSAGRILYHVRRWPELNVFETATEIIQLPRIGIL